MNTLLTEQEFDDNIHPQISCIIIVCYVIIIMTLIYRMYIKQNYFHTVNNLIRVITIQWLQKNRILKSFGIKYFIDPPSSRIRIPNVLFIHSKTHFLDLIVIISIYYLKILKKCTT